MPNKFALINSILSFYSIDNNPSWESFPKQKMQNLFDPSGNNN
jgi:hypothetical protein